MIITDLDIIPDTIDSGSTSDLSVTISFQGFNGNIGQVQHIGDGVQLIPVNQAIQINMNKTSYSIQVVAPDGRGTAFIVFNVKDSLDKEHSHRIPIHYE